MEMNVDKNEYESLSACSQVNYAIKNQDDSLSDSSETTLPSSETDAMLAMEDVQAKHAAVEEDALSTSSETTLPSSEAEAQMPHPEDLVEVKMEEEAEDNMNDSQRRSVNKSKANGVVSTNKRETFVSHSESAVDSPSTSNCDVSVLEEDTTVISNQLSQGGSYPCARCQRTFWSRPNLEAHERVHSGERPFDCAACGRTFAQACHLRNHEIAAHGRAGPPRAFACAACGRAFGRHSALAAHARVHAPRTEEGALAAAAAATTVAEVAATAVAAAAGASLAAAQVAPVTASPVTICPLAPSAVAAAVAAANARSSSTQASRPAGPVTCDVCGKTLSHRCSLARHMRTHTAAPRPRPHRCPRCSAAFGTPLQLADHERRHHTGERPFACARCTRRFHSKAHLKYHERSHDGARPFRCDFCHKAFMSQFGLTRHRRVHTGDFRYKCDECPDAFVSRGQLLAHARNHAASPGARRPFQCPLCTASFVQRGLLTLHLRKHTGEQPFRCARCQMGFPHRRLLVAHQAVCQEETSPPLQTQPLIQTSLLAQPSTDCSLITPTLNSTGAQVLTPGASNIPLTPTVPLPTMPNMTFTPTIANPPAGTNANVSQPSTAPVTLIVPSVIPTAVSTKPTLMSSAQVVGSNLPQSISSIVTPVSGVTLTNSISSPLASPARLVSSPVAMDTPPRPRLLLVTVKTPERFSRDVIAAHTPPKMAEDALTSTAVIVKVEQQGTESAKRVTFKVEQSNRNGEGGVPKVVASTVDRQDTESVDNLPGAVIVKMENGLDDDTSADVADVPEEAWRELNAISQRQEVDLGPMPPGAVIMKIRPQEMETGEIATVIENDDDEDSIAGVPLLIEQSDRGSSWPIPTAVVTVKIEDSDNDENWQDSSEDVEVKIEKANFDDLGQELP